MTLQFCILAAGLLMVADRLLLRAEERGWIFYRRQQAESGSATGAAFGPVFDLLQPTRQIVIEDREHQELLREEPGAEAGDWDRLIPAQR